MNTTTRCILALAVVNLVPSVGCGGARSQTRGDYPPALIAYARPVSDVPVAPAGRGNTVVKVEPVPQEVLRDPIKLMTLKRWVAMQIDVQARNLPEDRYQRLVRPRLAHELRTAGLSPLDVDYILRDVDYHRSL
jgi:hypothetical protein